VVLTVVVVAAVARVVLAELSWPMAFVLGAVLAPTDPVAATSVFRRTPVPERVAVVVEGESLVSAGAARLAIPLEASGRGVVLLVTFATILVTIVVQGLTLPLLVRACGLERSAEDERREQEARLQAAEAALQRLDRAAAEDEAPDEAPDTTVERLRTTFLEHAERADPEAAPRGQALQRRRPPPAARARPRGVAAALVAA
jgi:NhaP-type Na+/H+ or K+/H+ antiporter